MNTANIEPMENNENQIYILSVYSPFSDRVGVAAYGSYVFRSSLI